MDLYQPISKAATILSQLTTRPRNPSLPIHGHEAHQSLLGRESKVDTRPLPPSPSNSSIKYCSSVSVALTFDSSVGDDKLASEWSEQAMFEWRCFLI